MTLIPFVSLIQPPQTYKERVKSRNFGEVIKQNAVLALQLFLIQRFASAVKRVYRMKEPDMSFFSEDGYCHGEKKALFSAYSPHKSFSIYCYFFRLSVSSRQNYGLEKWQTPCQIECLICKEESCREESCLTFKKIFEMYKESASIPLKSSQFRRMRKTKFPDVIIPHQRQRQISKPIQGTSTLLN